MAALVCFDWGMGTESAGCKRQSGIGLQKSLQAIAGKKTLSRSPLREPRNPIPVIGTNGCIGCVCYSIDKDLIVNWFLPAERECPRNHFR
jgi:hypothetical protein